MLIDGTPYRSIWRHADGVSVEIIDQTRLPHVLETVTLRTLAEAAHAIRAMQVRGAPLIGVTAAYGMCLALRADASDDGLGQAAQLLVAQRPTAVNLHWAVSRMQDALQPLPPTKRAAAAFELADRMAEEDIETNRAIGINGATLIAKIASDKAGKPVNILTHCNAGWLAAVDHGTALAPIFAAHDAGIPVHVWVDETRPRNQGAALTAFELVSHGVPHTLIADNAGGHLMQQGLVDLCIVGADRVTANGDVCNKIGTYLKALAAYDTSVPFYVAIPRSTVDWDMATGRDVPIEQRSADEVLTISGRAENGEIVKVSIAPAGTPARNDAFDVTPANLVTALITENGIGAASAKGLHDLYGR
jgi:methylthioribose-1-phosphate isomerase